MVLSFFLAFQGNNIVLCILFMRLRSQSKDKTIQKQGQMTNYERDLMIEGVTADFLDKHFYYSIDEETGKPLFCYKKRIKDREQQLSGEDFIISCFGDLRLSQASIDEKGQAHVVYPSFAFELSYVMYADKSAVNSRCEEAKAKEESINWINEQNNYVHYTHEGWLTDDNKKTEFYLLIWYNKVNGKECSIGNPIEWNEEGENIINDIDCILIRRKVIKKIIERAGYTREGLSAMNNQILQSRISGVHERTDQHGRNNTVWFSFTSHLPETPINVVINKYTLFRHATMKYSISEKNNFVPQKIK